MARAAALLLVFLVAAGPVRAELSGAATVTAGDTRKVGAEQARLYGIDAPESQLRRGILLPLASVRNLGQ